MGKQHIILIRIFPL